MKQKISPFRSSPVSHINPVKFALFIAFGLVALAVGYKVMTSSTEIRSKAADNCTKWEPKITSVKAKTVRKKGGWVTIPEHNEVTYKCIERGGLQEAGGGNQNTYKERLPTKTPKPKTLQEQ